MVASFDGHRRRACIDCSTSSSHCSMHPRRRCLRHGELHQRAAGVAAAARAMGVAMEVPVAAGGMVCLPARTRAAQHRPRWIQARVQSSARRQHRSLLPPSVGRRAVTCVLLARSISRRSLSVQSERPPSVQPSWRRLRVKRAPRATPFHSVKRVRRGCSCGVTRAAHFRPSQSPQQPRHRRRVHAPWLPPLPSHAIASQLTRL